MGVADLTREERNVPVVGQMLTAADFKQGCPFCAAEHFQEGPHGGMSINFRCASCHATFNDMGPFGIEVLSRPLAGLLGGVSPC